MIKNRIMQNILLAIFIVFSHAAHAACTFRNHTNGCWSKNYGTCAVQFGCGQEISPGQIRICIFNDNQAPCSSNERRCDFLEYTCDQCSSDSLLCINDGGTWTNTGASTCNGYSCKRPCDSASVACTAKNGNLFAGVLQDTTVSDTGTTITNKCYYNCSHSPNPDSTVYLVEGNIVLSGPSESIPDGTKSEAFNAVRTTTGGTYVYDYLTPAASEYIDSIAAMKCVEHLWRCVINNKYVYWYDNQEVPAGCTNIVRVK